LFTENYWLIITKFDGKVAHWPRKKPLDFGDNVDSIMLRLGLWYG